MTGAIWLRKDGVGPGARLRVLVETERGWVVAIDELAPSDGEYEISHIVEPIGIESAPVDPMTGTRRTPAGSMLYLDNVPG